MTTRMLVLAMVVVALVGCDDGPETDADLTGVVVDGDGRAVEGVAIGVVFRMDGIDLPGDWKGIGEKPSAVIAYEVAEPGHVLFRVLDWERNLVRTLVDEDQAAGTHSFIWDGTDGNGDRIPSGMYIPELSVNGVVIDESRLFLYLHEPGEILLAPHAVTDAAGRFRISRGLLPLGADYWTTEEDGDPVVLATVEHEFLVRVVIDEGGTLIHSDAITEIPEGSASGTHIRITLE